MGLSRIEIEAMDAIIRGARALDRIAAALETLAADEDAAAYGSADAVRGEKEEKR